MQGSRAHSLLPDLNAFTQPKHSDGRPAHGQGQRQGAPRREYAVGQVVENEGHYGLHKERKVQREASAGAPEKEGTTDGEPQAAPRQHPHQR